MNEQDRSGKPVSAPGNDNPIQTPGLAEKARERFQLVTRLTDYDARLTARGDCNHGRLPILLHAAECAFEHACEGKSWLEALALEFTHHGAQFHLAPVNQFVKWLQKQQKEN